MTMTDLYNAVRDEICAENAFRLHQGTVGDAEYGTDIFSEGIKRMTDRSPEFAALTSDLARRFYACDFGSAYDGEDEDVVANAIRYGREDGYNETKFGVVRISRRGGMTTMYLDFER